MAHRPIVVERVTTLVGQWMDRDSIRKNNAKAILTTLLAEREAPRNHLAEKAGISVMSAGRIADELIALGFLQEKKASSQRGNTVGRPPKVLTLHTDRLLCCGVNLDKDVLHIGIVDPYGVIRERRDIPYPAEMEFSPEHILPWMAGEIDTFLEKWRGQGLLSNVGVTMPGIVDVQNGVLQFSANLRLKDCHVTAYLKERLPDFNFILENDSKALAQAEYQFGAVAGTQNMVVLSMGAGIGSAAILNGEVYRARNNMAGEIGHIVLNPAGKICECGKIGCLQTNLTKTAILNEAHFVYPGIGLTELLEYASRGETFAEALIKQVVEYISMTINLLANTYAPDAILLSGTTIWECPGIFPLVERDYKRLLSEYMQDTFLLRLDSFGADGYVIGGGAVAFKQTVETMQLRHV